MINAIMMLQEVPLPSPDPLPLPAPPIVLLFLLFLTFVLHMIAMNFTVGGTLLQVVNGFRPTENLSKLSSFLTKALPICLSFTVTLGIAPLLFIQLLYGQIFFSTSILMAWVWLGMLALLMIAYYGLYYFQFKSAESTFARIWVPLIGFVLLLCVMIIFIMNFRLFYMADQWEQIYNSGASGLYLNFGHEQMWPSFFHYLTGAIAVSGLLVVIHGWVMKSRDEAYSSWAAKFGGLLFAIPTALQFAFGTWLLMSLPRDLMKQFMFGDMYATTVLFLGMGMALVAVLLMMFAALKKRFGFPVVASGVALVVIIAAMTLVRHYVRDYYLIQKGLLDVSTLAVEGQWDTMILFGVLLVGGLATVGWMIYKVITGKGAEPVEAGQA